MTRSTRRSTRGTAAASAATADPTASSPGDTPAGRTRSHSPPAQTRKRTRRQQQPPKQPQPKQTSARATRAGGRTAAAKRNRRSSQAASSEDEKEDEEEKEEGEGNDDAAGDHEDGASNADADADAEEAAKKDGPKQEEEEEEEEEGDVQKSGKEDGPLHKAAAAIADDRQGHPNDDDDEPQQSAVSSLSGSSSSDDDDGDDDMPLSKLREEKERRDKARAERAKRKAKLKAKREAAAASTAASAASAAATSASGSDAKAKDKQEAEKETLMTKGTEEKAEEEVAVVKEMSNGNVVKDNAKSDGDDNDQDGTIGAAAGDTAGSGNKVVAEQAAAAGGGDEKEEDLRADKDKADMDEGQGTEAPTAPTAAAADDAEGGATTATISATADADIGAPPPEEAAATGSDAKETTPVESSTLLAPLPNVVEPPAGTADATPVQATVEASASDDDAKVVEATGEGSTEKKRGDENTPAGADAASGPVDGSELHVTASAQKVHDAGTATDSLPPSQPNQSDVPPEPDTAEISTVDNSSATLKPLASEVEGTEDAEMEDVGNQTNAAGTHPPSSPANGPAPMEIEEKVPVKLKVDDADRKRSLGNEDDPASPGHKRQRIESDEPPPKPTSSTEDSSQVVTQDSSNTPSAMPESVQSPEVPSSHTPTANMTTEQGTAEQSPQDESDEIRKVLEPALSASSGSPNASSQPPTPLFESRPRSMSISPPSDPNHSRLCSPVHFTAQGHHDVAAEEKKGKELESVEYTQGPCLETIKMNLYLEGRKVHRGNGPERQFADYWDALARNIAIGLRGKDKSKRWSNDEACNGIEYCLDSFLITKKMKRLHNELILAIMKQSLATLVEEKKFKRHIPIAWRGKARKKIGYPQKPSSMATAKRDVEAKQEDDTDSTLEEDLKLDLADSRRLISMFAHDSPVWSASGQKSATAEGCVANEISLDDKCEPLRSVIPSANLPGALIIDPFVRSSAKKQNMKVSEDAIWLATTAVRDYATTVLRNAVQNKVDAREGHIFPASGIATAAASTISPFDLALGNCNSGPHSIRVDDQGLNAQSTPAYSSGLSTSKSISTERKVSGAIHVAARQRLLASKLPKGS